MVKNTEQFLQKIKSIYGDKYDYSKVKYNGVNEDVTIICPIHGEFLITPKILYYGKGCPQCSGNVRKKRKTKTTEQFINEAKQVHGNKYDYSKTQYIQSDKKITIICPIHGEFYQRASSHLSGCGCPKCGTVKGISIKKKSIEQFIDEANIVHNNKYNYTKVDYKNAYTKIKIICPEHGEFEQTPNAHLKGEGCPTCSKSKHFRSKGEQIIENWLLNNNISYNYNYEIKLPFIVNKTNIILADFYISSKNIIIEYNGIQHYEPIKYFGGEETFKKQQERDNILSQYCNDNSISLITIKYDLNKEEIIRCLEKLFQ